MIVFNPAEEPQQNSRREGKWAELLPSQSPHRMRVLLRRMIPVFPIPLPRAIFLTSMSFVGSRGTRDGHQEDAQKSLLQHTALLHAPPPAPPDTSQPHTAADTCSVHLDCSQPALSAPGVPAKLANDLLQQQTMNKTVIYWQKVDIQKPFQTSLSPPPSSLCPHQQLLPDPKRIADRLAPGKWQ